MEKKLFKGIYKKIRTQPSHSKVGNKTKIELLKNILKIWSDGIKTRYGQILRCKIIVSYVKFFFISFMCLQIK